MLGKVCRFYGWTVDYCLAMPASRFFLMLEQVDKLQGKELAQLCYVSRSAKINDIAFAETVEIFNNTGQKRIKPPDVDVSDIQKQPPLTLAQQKAAICAAFSSDHRVHRKVMRKH